MERLECKYLILGAGPAGLTVGNALLQKGENDFWVIEAEAEVGGLCRSCIVDGAPFDIGGGHFLDVRRPKVNEFLFHFMPEEEWNSFKRDSRISIHDSLINHPLEANIWQFPVDLQVQYLKSVALAGCNIGEDKPELFVDWIRWKLGDKIADEYMLPYNQKMFGDNLNILGTYWMEKLPNVSFEEILRSCLEKRAYGTQPGHANFYYPKKFGYGELWRRMGKTLDKHLKLNSKVVKMNANDRSITLSDKTCIKAENIITTIPWKSINEIEGASEEVRSAIDQLEHSGIETRYFNDRLDTEAHWIYYPEPEKAYHRILVRHNFCPDSKGYWTETNARRIAPFSLEDNDRPHFFNQFAYPLNTLSKPEKMRIITAWAEKNGIYPLGRWGEHQHFNSDLTVERGLQLVSDIL